MAKDNTETELKLIIDSPEEVIQKLKKAGAKELGLLEQEDIIWDYAQKGKSFDDKKQSLRLRLQLGENDSRAIVTFKEASFVDLRGIKTRREYNIVVSDFDAMRKVLESIGFKKALVVRKKRRVFRLGDLEITVDELPFGNYVELEGEKRDIKEAIKKLRFDKYPVETRPYFVIQREL